MFRVYIKNTGPGISEKFTQKDGASIRKYADTGLGLSISKAIVEHHNGNIDYISDESSTTFYFDLPRS